MKQESVERELKELVQNSVEKTLNEATKKLQDGMDETLTYVDFSLQIRTNNVIERMIRDKRL